MEATHNPWYLFLRFVGGFRCDKMVKPELTEPLITQGFEALGAFLKERRDKLEVEQWDGAGLEPERRESIFRKWNYENHRNNQL